VLNEQNKFYSSLYSNKETEDNLNVHLVDSFFPDDDFPIRKNTINSGLYILRSNPLARSPGQVKLDLDM
jgi:hypothetical protein